MKTEKNLTQCLHLCCRVLWQGVAIYWLPAVTVACVDAVIHTRRWYIKYNLRYPSVRYVSTKPGGGQIYGVKWTLQFDFRRRNSEYLNWFSSWYSICWEKGSWRLTDSDSAHPRWRRVHLRFKGKNITIFEFELWRNYGIHRLSYSMGNGNLYFGNHVSLYS